MLTNARLVYLVIYVDDLRASRLFYERGLGFRPIEADGNSSKYDAGHVILCLVRARDVGIALPPAPDRSADITFLVDDLEAMQSALERRGVQFAHRWTYEVGSVIDFYDPDGHWFSLYEPSELAKTWPSGAKIRAFWSPNGTAKTPGDLCLDRKDLMYLFLFVQRPHESFEFYHGILGLRSIEGGSCKRGATHELTGVIKYDAGGTLLTTHHLDDEHAAKHGVNPSGTKATAVVFQVPDIQRTMAELSDNGVRFGTGPTPPLSGIMAAFEDPSGHAYYLYELSEEAWGRPSGTKIKQILAASL
jgi:catechol 2,3-dioxygenase-like lactoylglutathione lyase family enzyme